MGMLDRYKKKNGFVQLLILIETSEKKKQEQFLNLIAQESKVWEEAIRKHMLSLDKIMSWDGQVRAEIFSRVQPLTLATVLHGMPQENLDNVLSCISMGEKRKIMGVIAERNPTPAEKATCVMKIVAEVRQLCTGGIIKLDKVDPELAIPENYEELLHHEETAAAASAPASGDGLVFPDFDHKTTSASHSHAEVKSDTHGHRPNSEEVEFLKKKVNQLTAENNTLKHDLNLLRNKLDQIRKIA